MDAGVEQISLDQEITFTLYRKVVLPVDGFVFWVKADLLAGSAVFNTTRLNSGALGAPPRIAEPAPTLTVKGSLHYATDLQQQEAESSTRNRMVFTSRGEEVRALNDVGPDELYICMHEGVQFAFSSRSSYYAQSGLHHMTGQAVFNDMATQVIDDPRDFSQRQVVSNSLPIWMTLGAPIIDWPFQPMPPLVPVYPSYLVDQNINPPWIAVHIGETDTTAIASVPYLGSRLQHYQLSRDVVRLTFYGLRNDEVQDFMDAVFQYSLDTGNLFGILNMPIIADAKRTQVELGTLAQRKTATFEISYNQQRMRDLSRQLILSALVTYEPGDLVVPINLEN